MLLGISFSFSVQFFFIILFFSIEKFIILRVEYVIPYYCIYKNVIPQNMNSLLRLVVAEWTFSVWFNGFQFFISEHSTSNRSLLVATSINDAPYFIKESDPDSCEGPRISPPPPGGIMSKGNIFRTPIPKLLAVRF